MGSIGPEGGMEKYGVVIDTEKTEKTKTGGEAATCPDCGSRMSGGDMPLCPKCGTKPFEKKP